MKIAVCIPTYKRLDLLTEAIESCLTQTLLPDEILIGDNSPDDDTQALVAQLTTRSAVTIRYFHHVPGLNQAQNVDSLFQAAASDLLVLLHDDDTLLPNCLRDLHGCFVENPAIDVAFGKQYMMSHEGQVDYRFSETINREFYRTPQYAGTVLTATEAVILQQFPNDCYMIRTAVAQKETYNGLTMHACDFEFGLKIGTGAYTIYFFDEYTANYRLSADALSRNYDNNGSLVIYRLVEQLNVPTTSFKYKKKILVDKASVALAQAANLKLAGEARKIFFSPWHRSAMLSLRGMKGIYHLVRAHV